MVARVEVRPDEEFTARFPNELCAHHRLRQGPAGSGGGAHWLLGGIDNPMSWDRVVEKFHWLSEAFADKDLRSRLIQAVQQLDARPIVPRES